MYSWSLPTSDLCSETMTWTCKLQHYISSQGFSPHGDEHSVPQMRRQFRAACLSRALHSCWMTS